MIGSYSDCPKKYLPFLCSLTMISLDAVGIGLMSTDPKFGTSQTLTVGLELFFWQAILATYVMAKIHYFIQQDWTSKLSTIEDQFQSCSVEQSTGGDIKVSLLDKSSPNSGDIAATIPRKSSFQSFPSLLRLFRTKQTSDWRGNNEGSKVFQQSGEVLSWRPKCNFLHWCILNSIYKSFMVRCWQGHTVVRQRI